jgi:hypothetical protein
MLFSVVYTDNKTAITAAATMQGKTKRTLFVITIYLHIQALMLHDIDVFIKII